MIRSATLTLLFSATVVTLLGCGGEVDEISPKDVAAIRGAPEVTTGEGDWPWWRGPTRDNHAAGPAPPTTWNANENVVWRVRVPGSGHASPIVVGENVVVATADEPDEAQMLVCYERSTGKQRWERTLHNGGFEKVHNKNSQASATPACDGEKVFAAFLNDGAIWVSAVNLEDGQVVWQEKAGDFSSKHGYGSSPLIYKSLVIVSGDSSSKSFLTALDRRSGEIVWRTRRENEHSFGTPIVGEVAGKTQLLLNGQESVTSYDPASGKQLWQADGSTDSTGHTMAWDDEFVFSGAGWPSDKMIAIKADGTGERVWEQKFNLYVPSPLVSGDRLYCMNDEGRLYCLDTKTGKTRWRKRLDGGFSASLVLAGGFIFVPNEEGTMYVFRDADKYEQVAVNSLSNGGFASPVICGGQLFLRTNKYLYCIGYPST